MFSNNKASKISQWDWKGLSNCCGFKNSSKNSPSKVQKYQYLLDNFFKIWISDSTFKIQFWSHWSKMDFNLFSHILPKLRKEQTKIGHTSRKCFKKIPKSVKNNDLLNMWHEIQILKKSLIINFVHGVCVDLFKKNRTRTVLKLPLFCFDFLWISLYFWKTM